MERKDMLKSFEAMQRRSMRSSIKTTLERPPGDRPMDEIFRLPGAVEHEPAIDVAYADIRARLGT
jgi:hypothetical protein